MESKQPPSHKLPGPVPTLDMEFSKVLDFIRGYIDILEREGRGSMREFAKACGLSQKNLTNLRNYGPDADPSARVVWKFLRGAIGPHYLGLTQEDGEKWAMFLRSFNTCPEFMEKVLHICIYLSRLPKDYVDTINFALEKALGRIQALKAPPPAKGDFVPWWRKPYLQKPE